MEIPVIVLERMKTFFGFDGVHHQILDSGNWIDTGCLEWKLSSFDLEPPKLDPLLAEVIEKIMHQVSEENFDTRAGNLNMRKYQARIMELFHQIKIPELQKELETMISEYQAFNDKYSKWLRTHKISLEKIRTMLQGEQVIAYWGGTWWEGNIPASIVVAPTTDQFEILNIEQTSGVNYGVLNNDIVSQMQTLDEKYGIDIVGASPDSLDFVLKRVPKGKDATELGEWLLKFCPDIFEAPRSFPKGKVSLWWD